MTFSLTSLLVTYVVFGLLGIFLGRRFKGTPGVLVWIILVVLTVVSQWILPGVRVIAVLQFHMYANRILQAFFAGVLLGLLVKGQKS